MFRNFLKISFLAILLSLTSTPLFADDNKKQEQVDDTEKCPNDDSDYLTAKECTERISNFCHFAYEKLKDLAVVLEIPETCRDYVAYSIILLSYSNLSTL